MRHQARRFRHLRMVTSSWLFHLFFAGIVIVLVFSHPPLFFRGDTDTARNYLNTIVSSLSTILALCISIILVAIQMTAGNYTHRVLDFFVRLPYNASLFSFFLVTIMHSFFLMAKIRDPERDPLPRPLQLEMSADFILIVICFLSLLVYIYAVVQLLKPERIIQLILREYDVSIEAGNWQASLESIEQICDIVKRAASVNDSLTGTFGVERMQAVALDLPMPKDDKDAVLTLHRSLVAQWGEIIGVTVKEKETGILYVALEALYRQGCVYIHAQAWTPAQDVVKTYRSIVFSHLLPDGQVYYAEIVADRLYRLAAIAAKDSWRGQQFAVRSWETVHSCGENCFRLGTGSPSLFAGFLMSEEIPGILCSLVGTSLYHRALLSYFSLWKTFILVAQRKDVTMWAMWWADQTWDADVDEQGRFLALQLASHHRRDDVADTLTWMLPPQKMGAQACWRYPLQPIWATLFDGVPPTSEDTGHRD